STLLLGLGLYALGSIHTLGPFVLVAVLSRALSQPGLIGVVPQTVAARFFRRQRNLALAVIGLFRPTSSAILIQLISRLAVASSWRFAFRWLGLLSVLLTLPMLLILRRCPEEIGLSEIRFTNQRDRLTLEFGVTLPEREQPRAVRIIIPLRAQREDDNQRERDINSLHRVLFDRLQRTFVAI